MKFFVAVIVAAAYAVLRRAAVKPAARIFEPSVIYRVDNLHYTFRRPVLDVFDNQGNEFEPVHDKRGQHREYHNDDFKRTRLICTVKRFCGKYKQ